MRCNNIDEIQDEIYKLKEANRNLLYQKDYLEQQLAESETAREYGKLLDTETFWEHHEHLRNKCIRQEESKVPKELDSTHALTNNHNKTEVFSTLMLSAPSSVLIRSTKRSLVSSFN